MGFTIIEYMAVIILIGAVIKILVVLINPKGYLNFAKGIWSGNTGLIQVIYLILAAGSLYYLTQSGITIVQIWAVMFFIAFLVAIGVAGYANEILKIYEKQVKSGKLLKGNWLSLIVWIALIIWGLITLFI